MRKKLTLDELAVESFETTAAPAARGTVFGRATEAFYTCASDCPCDTAQTNCGCGSGGCGDTANGCPAPSDEPCTWYPVFTCETNQIAYPSECTGCEFGDCNPTYDYCPTPSPGYDC